MNCYLDRKSEKIVLQGRAGEGQFRATEKTLERKLAESYYESKLFSQEELDSLENLYCSFFSI